MVKSSNLTCLIPFYRSKRFRSIVIKNIDQHLQAGMKVLVSDRHLLDAFADEIKVRYRNNSSLKVVKNNDKGDWVDNINGMISLVETEYFRILPHDDSATAQSSYLLVEALEDDKDAILATGVVKATSLLGIRLPKRDELNEEERLSSRSWSMQDNLEFFWMGRYAGSFKGVVRTEPIQKLNLLIKKTPSLVHSERSWLFALTLLGKFLVVPKSILVKRYYSTSTHKSWVYSDKTTMDAASCMAEYCDDLIDDCHLRAKIKFSLYYNALNKVRPIEKEPTYYSLMPEKS